MANKITDFSPSLTSWADVDEALRIIGECENRMAEIQA